MDGSGGVRRGSEVEQTQLSTWQTKIKDKYEKVKTATSSAWESIKGTKADFEKTVREKGQEVSQKRDEVLRSSEKLNRARESVKNAKATVKKTYWKLDNAAEKKYDAMKEKLTPSNDSKIRQGYNAVVDAKKKAGNELQALRDDLRAKIGELKQSIKELDLKERVKLPSMVTVKMDNIREAVLSRKIAKRADDLGKKIDKGLRQLTTKLTTDKNKEVEKIITGLRANMKELIATQQRIDDPVVKENVERMIAGFKERFEHERVRRGINSQE